MEPFGRTSCSRDQMRRKEQELHELRSGLEKEAQRLADEKAALGQASRRLHGEEELSKRQLQNDWDGLRREQQQWTARRTQEQVALHEQAQALDQRERALTAAR